MREHATQGKSLPDRRRRSPAARTRKTDTKASRFRRDREPQTLAWKETKEGRPMAAPRFQKKTKSTTVARCNKNRPRCYAAHDSHAWSEGRPMASSSGGPQERKPVLRLLWGKSETRQRKEENRTGEDARPPKPSARRRWDLARGGGASSGERTNPNATSSSADSGPGLHARVKNWKPNGSTARKWKSARTWWHPEPKIKTEN
jgi:hypothetical protein